MDRNVQEITEFIYPNPISLEEFVAELAPDVFMKNMKMFPELDRPKYIEDWFVLFARWHDVKEKPIVKSINKNE